MKATEQTLLQVNRAIRKIAQKFPSNEEPSTCTDIHLRVSQESGELLALDDEEQEITRCVVEQWIENTDEDFYKEITSLLRDELRKSHDIVENMGVVKPYSFVLEDDDRETIAELYMADGDTIIVGDNLMKGVEEDLDDFLADLMKDHLS